MKTIIKNNKVDMDTFQRLAVLQQGMMMACLSQGLNLSSNIMKDSTGGWVFTYGVGFHNDGRVVFAGQAKDRHDEHYNYVMALIRGEMVSELFPPAGFGDPVSYWKRHLITDMDVTDIAQSSATKSPTVKNLWVGYQENGIEVVRVPDGTKNQKASRVSRIEYVVVPTRGLCVFMVPETYVEPVKDDFMQGMSTCGTMGTSPTMAAMAVSLSMAPIRMPNTKAPVVKAPTKPVPGKEYVVATGDTLSQISMDAYGRDDYVFQIQEANQDLIKDINVIFGGSTIMIPIIETKLEG